MLRRLYDYTLRLSTTRYALPALAAVAFVESSVFPIPPHVMMVPMIIALPHRAWLIALVATIASVLGGVLGYWIGSAGLETIGMPVLEFYGKAEKFGTFQDQFNAYGAWAVLFAGITPFPYKVITITSGATGLNFTTFLVASVIARSIIFFLLAGILWKFGPPVKDFVEKRFALVTTGVFALLLAGFLAVKWL